MVVYMVVEEVHILVLVEMAVNMVEVVEFGLVFLEKEVHMVAMEVIIELELNLVLILYL